MMERRDSWTNRQLKRSDGWTDQANGQMNIQIDKRIDRRDSWTNRQRDRSN